MQIEDYALLYDLEGEFWWFAGMRDITAALLDGLSSPASDRLILDAGCGTGANISWLSRYSGKGSVVGIDLAPAALEFCLKRGHDRLAVASIRETTVRLFL